MTKRFQIDELMLQDASGVVFRALDTETGGTVAVRRFFPFGLDGGGLDQDEQTAYNIAVSRLSGLSHPSLRSVICGGCDPVDGMPFIVTEWVEGGSLRSAIEQERLSAEAAIELLTMVLEVCELLSRVLAEEAVWVETDVRTIVVGDENSGRRFTFWISPLKWLGSGEVSRGLESVIDLTEEIMGWSGKVVSDQAGRGLGAWLKWLRGAAATTTLQEAREMLAASTGKEPPAPAKELVNQAVVRSLRKPARKPSPARKFAVMGVLLATIGASGWLLNHRKANPSNLPQSAALSEKSATLPVAAADRASQRAAELSARLQAVEQAAAEPGGVFAPDQHDLLFLRDGKETAVEGRLAEIHLSESGKTMYLLFSKNPAKNEARGAVKVSEAPADLSEASLAPLIGKTVRLHGALEIQRRGKLKRPEIQIANRSGIEVLD